jgi:hypothetical protein
MHRVSPFRKGIVRFTTAPVVSPQPKPPMRGTNLPCPVAPCSGLLLVPRHGWNLRCGRAVLQAPLGCASHTWCGVVFLGCLRQRPWGRFRRASLPGGRSGRLQRASVSPADWVRRRAPVGGWGRSRAQGGSRIMHSSTIGRICVGLAVLRVPYVRSTARPRRIGSVVELCMPGAPRPVPWSTAPPSAARRFHSLALSHSRVRARRARMPCGTALRRRPARHPCLA